MRAVFSRFLLALLIPTTALANDVRGIDGAALTECLARHTGADASACFELEATPVANGQSAGLQRGGPLPQQTPVKLPIGRSAVLGPKKARYTVVVFGDVHSGFGGTDRQCPSCWLRELVNDPALKGKINVVFKHFPTGFHQDARPAARIAVGIQQVGGDKAAWEFLDVACQAQRALTNDFFLTTIDHLQLARAPVLAAAEKADPILDEDAALGDKSGVTNTPTVFVNGWELTQRSTDGVKALISQHKL